MMKFGANVLETALKGLKLAKAGNYDHVLNLKYTCRALPSCFGLKCQGNLVSHDVKMVSFLFYLHISL